MNAREPKSLPDIQSQRDVAIALNADPRVLAYTVDAENFESIHNHSAFARVVRNRKQNGGDLQRRAVVRSIAICLSQSATIRNCGSLLQEGATPSWTSCILVTVIAIGSSPARTWTSPARPLRSAWQLGYADATRVLLRAAWMDPVDPLVGVVVHRMPVVTA